MSARDVIAKHLCTMAAQGWSGISAFERAAYRTTAIGMIDTLTSSGYRILGPDEVAAGGHLCGLPHYGEYTGQVLLAAPTFLKHKWPSGIGIDVCLALEIQELWKAGVETSGHCCGHGMSDPFISVWPNSVEKMRALGYEQLPHPDPSRNDHFKAKTAIRALCATHQVGRT